MKKTMFITSVIMVIVLAVALTTSSLAWFSATGATYVTTDSLKLSARGTVSTGIGISNDGLVWADKIDLHDGYLDEGNYVYTNANLYPVVPFAKSATPTQADLLAALVGGIEAPYITLADFAEDYAKYKDSDPQTIAGFAAYYDRAAELSNWEGGYLDDNDPDSYMPAVTYWHFPDAVEGNYGGYIYAAKLTEDDPDTEEDETTYGNDANGNLIDDTFEQFYADMVANNFISDQNILSTTTTQRDAYMIGNYIDTNNKFTSQIYRVGYYVDELYLKSLATGTNSVAISLDTAISFYTVNKVAKLDPNTNEPMVDEEGRTIMEDKEERYSASYRGAKYDKDPTLCVAVLALKNCFVPDNAIGYYSLVNQIEKKQAAIDAAIDAEAEDALIEDLLAEKAALQAKLDKLATSTYEVEYTDEDAVDITDWPKTKAALQALQAELGENCPYDRYIPESDRVIYNVNPEWEIIGYAESKAAFAQGYVPTEMNIGKQATNFLEEQISTASTYKLSVDGLNKNTTEYIRGKRSISVPDADDESGYKAFELPEDVLKVKVVAWYDGTTLNNNNSNDGTASSDVMNGSANIKFALKFSNHDQ